MDDDAAADASRTILGRLFDQLYREIRNQFHARELSIIRAPSGEYVAYSFWNAVTEVVNDLLPERVLQILRAEVASGFQYFKVDELLGADNWDLNNESLDVFRARQLAEELGLDAVLSAQALLYGDIIFEKLIEVTRELLFEAIYIEKVIDDVPTYQEQYKFRQWQISYIQN